MGSVLDRYDPPANPTDPASRIADKPTWTRWQRVVVASLICAICSFVVATTGVRTWRLSCDQITGTVRTQTWWFGTLTATNLRTSTLEAWIVRHEKSYTPTWQNLSIHKFNLFGFMLSRGCSNAPPSHLIGHDLIDNFVREAPEAKVAALVATMRTGTPAQQEAAIEAAGRWPDAHR